MVAIHIIDRDAGTRLAARRVLERAGFAVSEAADETQAATAPDLIIADLAEVSLAALRRDYPAARVLALGGYGDTALIAGSLDKPFTASQLLTAVRRSVARPR